MTSCCPSNAVSKFIKAMGPIEECSSEEFQLKFFIEKTQESYLTCRELCSFIVHSPYKMISHSLSFSVNPSVLVACLGVKLPKIE